MKRRSEPAGDDTRNAAENPFVRRKRKVAAETFKAFPRGFERNAERIFG